uniref:NADH dehydrogenase [ubiquinone] flavoprotein 3, mitochondrial n=1 Tax=Denticeps clupeoides TaxID=299321 RepID=A0AAY4BTP0_9TELE
MASSLLNIGRFSSFKKVQHVGRSGMKNSLPLMFCTKVDQPKTPTRKPKVSKVSPLPPEPVDFSTYKNLQHHHYNIYTFADLDVEMAKYRLPQPSSGRPSPRH